MRYTVVLTASFPPIARNLLAGEFDVIEHPAEPSRSEEDLITILADADAAITAPTDPVTRHVLESNANLRLVATFASTCDNIDLEAARDLGVIITNTPDTLAGDSEAMARIVAMNVLGVLRGGAPVTPV